MIWGFSGKNFGITENFLKILNISKKSFYLTLDVIATSLISIGGAWLTSKGIDQYSIYFDFSLKSLKNLILSPFFYLAVGVVLYMFAKFFIWTDNNNLLKNNNELINDKKEKENEKDSLNQQIRNITEVNMILKKKLELTYRELVKTWLSTSMKKLNISQHHTRATVYYFHENAFYYVGRYSSNPSIAEVSTNKVILNGGVLSKAWERGSYFDLESCPIYDENDVDTYITYQKENYDFSEEKIKNLTMKPCQYYAKTIIDRYEPIGVIIFECNERFLNENRVRSIHKHCTEHESNLISYIHNFKEYGFRENINSANSTQDIEAEFLDELEGKNNEAK